MIAAFPGCQRWTKTPGCTKDPPAILSPSTCMWHGPLLDQFDPGTNPGSGCVSSTSTEYWWPAVKLTGVGTYSLQWGLYRVIVNGSGTVTHSAFHSAFNGGGSAINIFGPLDCRTLSYSEDAFSGSGGSWCAGGVNCSLNQAAGSTSAVAA